MTIQDRETWPLRASTEAAIRAVEAQAERFETNCAAGRMVWRRWGAGEPVLLLHGGSGSWLHWLRTIPALVPTRSVWVPDLPGFGDSDAPPEPVSLDSYAALVQTALAHLRGETGSIDVAGFSLGAAVGVVLARRIDGRTKNLVLAGAQFAEPRSGSAAELISVRRIPDPEARRKAFRHNIKLMMLAHDESIDEIALDLYALDTMRRRLRQSYFGAEIMRDNLPHVALQARLTVISGKDDQVIGESAELQTEALQALKPDATYHAIPHAGHWVMYEGAEIFNAELLRALSG